jgi:small-conductance mechanosensitive channel
VSTVLDARIFNLSRSPPLWMNTTFNVDMGVTQADIDHVQNAMAAHIDSDPVRLFSFFLLVFIFVWAIILTWFFFNRPTTPTVPSPCTAARCATRSSAT